MNDKSLYSYSKQLNRDSSCLRPLLINLIFILFTRNNTDVLNAQDSLYSPPSYSVLRETENYSYLQNQEKYKLDYSDRLKNIALIKSGNINTSFGGQIRPRFEYFSNRFWQENDDVEYYSQRIALFNNINLGKQLRIFTELYHGYNSGTKQYAQYDDIDLFQLFIDFKIPISKNNKVNVRLGRQELPLGSSRLAGIREGPNIRLSYDMLKTQWYIKKTSIQAFYGKEVFLGYNSFDNQSGIFSKNKPNPSLWGIYSQFKIKGDIGKNELYYLGFHVNSSKFNDVAGEETRHTVGLRRFGKIGKHWRYNTELIYQLGSIESSEINAFSIATDAYYKWNDVILKPELGLKLEFSTGDKELNDGKIQSFNPMFVNPAHYSLAGTITPVNLLSVHPSLSFQLRPNWRIYTEWAFFRRNSGSDALYRPTRFVNISANANHSKQIGNQFGLSSSYKLNRHLSLDLNMSYFLAGKFLKENGMGNNIFHFAPTLNYRF